MSDPRMTNIVALAALSSFPHDRSPQAEIHRVICTPEPDFSAAYLQKNRTPHPSPAAHKKGFKRR